MAKWKVFKRNWAPVTGKHWQVLDDKGQCNKVFSTFEEALFYADCKARAVEVVIPRVCWGTVKTSKGADACHVTHVDDGFEAVISSRGERVSVGFGQMVSVGLLLLAIRQHYRVDLVKYLEENLCF